MSYPLNIQLASKNGQKYPSSKMNDIIISCAAPLIFGNADSEFVVFDSGKIRVAKNMVPLNNASICFGEQGNPMFEVNTKSLNASASVLRNTDPILSTYIPIRIVNDASNTQVMSQIVMNNGVKPGLILSQNGPCNIASPNAVFMENANGDLHFGSTNIISIYKSGSLSNTVCIGVAPNNIQSIEGYVGTTGAYKLIVNGLSWSAGWRTISDVNLKENINIIENACDKVSKLSGYTYNLKAEPKTKSAGLMAQEVLKVLPDVVDVMYNGSYAMDYNGIVALLVEAVKELHQRTI